MKKILLLILLSCIGNQFLNAQIQYSGCTAIIGSFSYPVALNQSGAVGTRNTYTSGNLGSCSAGACAFRIIWTGTAWEVQLSTDGGSSYNFSLYQNTTASSPNPPSMSLGTWTDVSGSGCGALTTLTGDVQSSISADTTAPTITSIGHQNPATSPTGADTVIWNITFSEAISNLDKTDFTISGTTASITGVSNISGNTYRVIASGGDLADLNGTVTLSLVANQNITDTIGNPLTNLTPTGTNNNTFDVVNDTTNPRISSITRQNPTNRETNADTVVWDVTFNEAVSNVDVTDFTISGTTATATNVTNPSGNIYRVTFSGGNLASKNGLVVIGFSVSQDISDISGNPLTNFVRLGTNENAFFIDNTAPRITSITRQSPTTSPTDADTLVWDVLFNEVKNNVDATDFTISGTTATISGVTNPSGNIYRITVTGGDLDNLNGTVTLNFSGSQDITDLASNALSNLTPTGTNDDTFDVANDTTNPRISSITRQNPTNRETNADTIVWDVTFNEAVSNVDVSDFTLSGTTATATSVTNPSGNIYRVTFSGGNLVSKNGLVIIGFSASQDISDTSGNPLTNFVRLGTNENAFAIDNTAPVVTSVTVPLDNTYLIGQDLLFNINFNENIVVNTTGGTPQLSITIGSMVRQVAYQSGSGTQNLVFSYIIQSNDLDSDGITVDNLSINGSTLQDIAGNTINSTLNNIENTSNILVNTCEDIPAFIRVTDETCPDSNNGEIKAAAVIFLQDFEEASGIYRAGTNVITGTQGLSYETSGPRDGRLAFRNDFRRPNSIGSTIASLDNPSGESTNRLTQRVDLSAYVGDTDIKLNFWWYDHGDEGDNEDIVQIRENSTAPWITIYSFDTNSNTNGWSYAEFDLDNLLSSDGQSLSSTFEIRFSQQDNFPINTDGISIDDIAIFKENIEYNFSWSNGDVSRTQEIAGSFYTSTISGLDSGNYSVVISSVIPNCSTTFNLTVNTANPADDASFNYSSTTYSPDGTTSPIITGLTGGTFTSATGLVIDGLTGQVDLTNSTIGSYTVTYTTAGICPQSSTASITIEDTRAPTVTSITRQNPTTSPTDADTLVWDITFNEAVNNVDTTDFTISGTTASITNVTNPSGNIYRITITGGDLDNLNGTVTLNFSGSQYIEDLASNTLTDLTPTGTNDNTFVVSNPAEVNLSVSSNTTIEALASEITVTATADVAVTGDQTIDIDITGTGITATDYALSNTTITILAGATTGTVTFTIQDDIDVEGDETVTLTINNPSSGVILGTTSSQNITITEFNPFITTWETTAASEMITIPTVSIGYHYSIDWGDGSIESITTDTSPTHTYDTAGIQTIKIYGDFPRIYFNNGGDRTKLQTIAQWGDIEWTNMARAFRGCSNLNITATDVPDLSIVTNMNYMFNGASSLNADISNWDVSNVTDMYETFRNATQFNSDISGWEVSNVTRTFGMFRGATSFDQNLGAWNVEAVTDMTNMFNGVTLSTANYDALLIGWNNQTLRNGVNFHGGNSKYCLGETAKNNMIDVSGDNWSITDGGLDCSGAFITTWETSTFLNVVTIPIFLGETYNYTIDWGDGTIETNQTGIATHNYGSSGIKTIKIFGDFPRIYFPLSLFKSKILTIEQWGDIAWTSMEGAFYECSNLNITNTSIDAPDLSGVTNMSGMFYGASSFNGAINHWDVSTVENMSGLFYEASNFNQNLNDWTVTNVTDMSGMFYEASSFNQDLNDWAVTSVTDMSGMFNKATAFDGNISNWIVSEVTTMEGMFFKANAFNQNIGGWTVSKVENMYGMFEEAYAFNQDLSTWDVGLVTDMRDLFQNATSFNQDLSSWNLTSVTVIEDIFNGSGIQQANYDNLLIGWNTNTNTPDNLDLGIVPSAYCTGESARTNLINTKGWTIIDDGIATTSPNINTIADVTAIATYTLPVITGTNLTGNKKYYTEAGGTGTVYEEGAVLSYTDFASYPTTLYAYDNASACSLGTTEQSFALTLTPNYCLPTYNQDCTMDGGDFINSFTFNTISNLNTGCTGSLPNNYTDYRATHSTSINAGNIYNVSCSPGPNVEQYFAVWIDFNHDGDFDEVNEYFDIGFGAAGGTITKSITIPPTALNGTTTLRVLCRFGIEVITQTEACSSQTWGECEDYTVNITNNIDIIYDGVNWSGGSGINGEPTIADATKTMLIEANVALTENAIVDNMIISNGAVLTVPDTQFLQVTNGITLHGDIYLEGTAELIQTETTDTNTGSGNLYKILGETTTSIYRYNYLSSPVHTVGTYSLSNNLNFNTGVTLADNIAPTFTTDNDGFGTTLSSTWLYTLNGTDYTKIDQNTALNPGVGFTMKGTGTTNNYNFIGSPNNGDITPLSIATNEFSLVGNPYPSAIEADAFNTDMLASNITDGTIYLWDQPTGTGHRTSDYDGGYATRIGGVSAPAAGVTSPNTPTNVIKPGQGFIVAGGTSGGAITFTNSMRIPDTNNGGEHFFKTSNTTTEPNPIIRLGFEYETDQGTYHRQLVTTPNGGSLGYDIGKDAKMLDEYNNDAYLLVKNKNDRYVITSTLLMVEDLEIPVGVVVDSEKQVTFKLDGLENMTNTVYLLDKENNTVFNLSDNDYTTTVEAGNHQDRFKLVLSNIPLSNNEVETTKTVIYVEDKTLHIILEQGEIHQVVLYNLLGKKLLRYINTEITNSTSINVSSLPSDVYVVEIITENNTITKKIVID